MASCNGGNSNKANGEDSLTESVPATLSDESIAAEPSLELTGLVVDEMMSTVTLCTDDGDTIVYIKGENFESDAAIGDKVTVLLDQEEDEWQIVKVEKI